MGDSSSSPGGITTDLRGGLLGAHVLIFLRLCEVLELKLGTSLFDTVFGTVLSLKLSVWFDLVIFATASSLDVALHFVKSVDGTPFPEPKNRQLLLDSLASS